LNQDTHTYYRHYREWVFAAISAGFFFILVGMIFVTRPGLYDPGLRALFNASEWENTTVGNTNITLPVPKQSALQSNAYGEVYTAAFEFCLVWGLFQILILALRFFADSPRRRKARTVSSAVFWLGAAYLISTYLNSSTTRNTWFIFWAAIVVLLGVSLIVRAIALAILR
jgi:hypothetical protein